MVFQGSVVVGSALLIAALAFVPDRADAQIPARHPGSVIHYAPNESGGRIRVVGSRDTTAVEGIRLALLEAAAAIRRGDLRAVWLLPVDSPALPVVAGRREHVRCTYRPLPHGGELVILSDDGDTIAAIHQLLAHDPPRLPILER